MYAANLAQKARELKREKRKSDTLLFQMLPPSVAQQLKQTQQVNLKKYFKSFKPHTHRIYSKLKKNNIQLEIIYTQTNNLIKI